MKKRTIAAIMMIIAVLAVFLTGCGSKVPEEITGEWKCLSTASDGETYTGFYALTIDSDGAINLYDAEAGNPGIEGKITAVEKKEAGKEISEQKGNFNIKFNNEDFDPPYCWKLSSDKDIFDYELTADGSLRLCHNGIWMTFERE